MPGHDCHALQVRLAECVPFLPAAALAAASQGDDTLAEALQMLEAFIKGE